MAAVTPGKVGTGPAVFHGWLVQQWRSTIGSSHRSLPPQLNLEHLVDKTVCSACLGLLADQAAKSLRETKIWWVVTPAQGDRASLSHGARAARQPWSGPIRRQANPRIRTGGRTAPKVRGTRRFRLYPDRSGGRLCMRLTSEDCFLSTGFDNRSILLEPI